MRVLIVDNDLEINDFLSKGLRAEFFVVDAVRNGKEGLQAALSCNYDLMIIDLNIPEVSGQELVIRLRKDGKMTPIIILTEEDDVELKIELFEYCDDYITKPFCFPELVARIRAILRRGKAFVAEQLCVDDLYLDVRGFKVHRNGHEIPLRNKEFALLEYMMRNTGLVLTRSEILEKVWDMNTDPFTNTVDVHINHLREKIDVGFGRKLIKTVSGRGYKIDA